METIRKYISDNNRYQKIFNKNACVFKILFHPENDSYGVDVNSHYFIKICKKLGIYKFDLIEVINDMKTKTGEILTPGIWLKFRSNNQTISNFMLTIYYI